MAPFVVFVFFVRNANECIIGHGPWKGSIHLTCHGGIMKGYLDHFGKGGKGCLDHNNNSHHMG